MLPDDPTNGVPFGRATQACSEITDNLGNKTCGVQEKETYTITLHYDIPTAIPKVKTSSIIRK